MRMNGSLQTYLREVDEQTEMLVKYDDAVNEMHSVAEVEAFSFSFRLGVRLMIETEEALTK